MKLNAGGIRAFLGKPDAAMRAVLLYGPDTGLVKERAEALTKTRVADLHDPFGVSELGAGDLKTDPARLADEAQALSLGGGGRVVRVRQATDGCSDAVRSFLELDTPAEAMVLIEAGELGPRSSLRKLFEGAANAVALPCYADGARDLADVVRQTLSKNNLTIGRDAMAALVQSLGADRGLTRGELEKLVLYKDSSGEVTIEDVAAVVGDAAATSMDDVVNAAAVGDAGALDSALSKTLGEGANPVQVVRAAQRHFQRLHLAAGEMAKGKSAGDAMKALRPPVFFQNQDRFVHQLRLWPVTRLARAFELLTEAELGCKSTGLPAEAICGRALIQIAQAARSARR